MGRIGEEITLKIKSAVKAKLIELGIEIDNELPDYIMVLVANKKTQDQMERDLQLFLGSNTIIFCTWLMNVLKKLEEVTVSNRSRKEKEVLKPKTVAKQDDLKSDMGEQSFLKKIKKEDVIDMEDTQDNDCLETRITAQEGLLGAEEDPEPAAAPVVEKSPTEKHTEVEKPEDKSAEAVVDKVELVSESRPKTDEGRKRRSRSRQRMRSDRMERSERLRKRSRSPHYSGSRKRRSGSWNRGGRSDSISPRRYKQRSPATSRSRYREYDSRSSGKSKGDSPSRRFSPDRKKSRLMSSSSNKGSETRLASLVRISSPPPRQSHIGANSKLLLKAVADAEKSVSSAERKSKREPPKLKEILPQKEQQQPQKDSSGLMYLPPEKLYVTLQNSSRGTAQKSWQNDDIRAVRRNDARHDMRMSIEEELMEECLDFEVDDEEYVPEPVIKSSVSQPSYVPSYHGYSLIDLEKSARFIMSPERSPSPWKEEEASRAEWKKDPPAQDNLKTVVTIPTQVIRNTVTPSYRATPYGRGRGSGGGGRGGFQSRFKLSHITDATRPQVSRTALWERLGPPPTATVRPMPVTKDMDTTPAAAANGETIEKPDPETLKLEAINKALERCKFWPDCTDSACVFYHPTSPCKMFPACKYGLQCLFVHPDCKFASDCTNPTCNYSHKNAVKGGYALLCIYYPNCTNPFCKFRHPAKPCRYGGQCARTDCFYSHPPKPVIPPRDLLSWKAPEKV